MSRSLNARLTSGVLSLLLALPAAAQGEPLADEASEETTEAAVAIDAADLEAFVDGMVQARMESFDVVGVTVSVVHGGEMIFAKGYGYADLESRRPVEAEKTLFRPGSISKTFTWTAVMQLYEQGKLDLEADIRSYLEEVEIPETFPQPITMLHLMAHAPGFEDSALGHLFEDDADEVLPLIEYLKTHQPARVREPGVIPAYSNYGTALAGQIVANLSGMSFEDYVDQNLFLPLGMNSSTFREPWGDHLPKPMPERLVANMSSGYVKKNGAMKAGNFEFISPVGPAGALATTATDMARWMLMHLREGSYDGAQILAPETARLMHSRHFALDPILDGMAHGFIESRIHGYRAYGHGGGTVHFLSDLQMVPELGFGIFVSTNTTGGGGQLIGKLAQLVVERYFPGAEEEPIVPPADFAARAARFEGSYLPTRRSYTTLERLLMLPMSVMKITASDDGFLVLHGSSDASRWVEVAPLTFRGEESGDLIKFVEDDAGRITAFYPWMPIMVMEKLGPTELPQVLFGLLGLAVVVFLGALVGAWLRRRRAVEQSKGERWAARVALLAAATWLVGFLLLGAGVAKLGQGLEEVFYTFPQPVIVWGLTVALLATGLTVAAVVLLYPVWKARSWPLWRRLRHSVVVVLALMVVVVLNDLNAIGYHYF